MKSVAVYLRLAIALGMVAGLSHFAPEAIEVIEHSSDPHLLLSLFEMGAICALSFIVFYLTQGTVFPSFVVAIFFGMAAAPSLQTVVENEAVLATLVGVGATFILFGGGLETPFHNFKKLFWQINTLGLVGLLITSVAFSFATFFMGQWMGFDVSLTSALLLGAVLASTDPASIIPVLKTLRFKNRHVKDIIVSESAVTDVSGTLVTVLLLTQILKGTNIDSIAGGYAMLLSKDAAIFMLKEVGFGVLAGGLGYLLLEGLSKMKRTHNQEFEADVAFFFFVPIIAFVGAMVFGGSGYLAAFIAGLLFKMAQHLKETEHFFNHTIEGFLKPIIFLLLGALVDVKALIDYAPLGIALSLVFMVVIRPITVFVCLLPFSWSKNALTFKDMLMISFVRETGAIPAALLITIVGTGLAGVESLVPVGMWAILLTLIVQPTLTAWVAQKLQVAELIRDTESVEVEGLKPYVLLGSRGRSYKARLPQVMEWAEKHSIAKIVIMHCLEDKQNAKALAEVKSEFESIRKPKNIQVELMQRNGFLQDNIQELAEKDTALTAVFVGRKILDYRLDEIQKLPVPFFFLS